MKTFLQNETKFLKVNPFVSVSERVLTINAASVKRDLKRIIHETTAYIVRFKFNRIGVRCLV